MSKTIEKPAATSLQPIPSDETRSFGTPRSGSRIRVDTGRPGDVVSRHMDFDQDIDGSWVIWVDRVGSGDGDDRPPEGAITIYDPTVANFLEQLHAMISDPVAFGRLEIGTNPYR